MLLVRLLILFLLAYLVFLIFSILVSSSRIGRFKRNKSSLDRGEELVLCLQCQSYIPKAEAVSSHDNYFCREECARLFVNTRITKTVLQPPSRSHGRAD
jgi:hypothetical protein